MKNETLLVFAHVDEARAFSHAGVPHLTTGIGKVNAAIELTRALATAGPDGVRNVVVLGTAGALTSEVRLDTVYRVSAVVQHDFSLESPRIELEAAHPEDELGGNWPSDAVIATGDVFVQDDVHRATLASLGATLVDMETYAYASVCARFGIPLHVFKAPSDFADSSTTMDEWDGVVVSKSEQLLEFAEAQLPRILR